jgi:hypothetical protein
MWIDASDAVFWQQVFNDAWTSGKIEVGTEAEGTAAWYLDLRNVDPANPTSLFTRKAFTKKHGVMDYNPLLLLCNEMAVLQVGRPASQPYYIIFDGSLKYAMLKVPKGVPSAREDYIEAGNSGLLLTRSLVTHGEYNQRGIAVIFRMIGGKKGSTKSVYVQRICVRPTRQELEEIQLWGPLVTCLLDKEFSKGNHDPTGQVLTVL